MGIMPDRFNSTSAPEITDIPPPGTSAAIAVQAYSDGAQLCALGHHAWMPWLAVQHPDTGTILRYATYCVRCRHHEQYDL